MSFWENPLSFPFGTFLTNIKARQLPRSHRRSFWMACKDSCLVIKNIPLQTLDLKVLRSGWNSLPPRIFHLIDTRVRIVPALLSEYFCLSNMWVEIYCMIKKSLPVSVEICLGSRYSACFISTLLSLTFNYTHVQFKRQILLAWVNFTTYFFKAKIHAVNLQK